MTMRVWLSTWMRPRRSTWVLMALFALTLVVYLWVRPPAPFVVTIAPDGTPVISTPRASLSHKVNKEPTPRVTTSSPTSTPTTLPTTRLTAGVPTPDGTPTPSGTPTTATATTPAPTPT